MPTIVCVEGLIGAGKSTLIDSLENDISFKIVHEPVEEFTKFANHNPLKLQNESSRYNDVALVQMYIIGAVERRWKETLANCSPNQIIISDRSLYSPNIFSRTLRRRGDISSFAHDFLVAQADDAIRKVGLSDFAADQLFFLDTPPEECLVRIKKRARPEEICCDMSYLCDLNAAMVDYIEAFGQCRGTANVKVVKSGNIQNQATAD